MKRKEVHVGEWQEERNQWGGVRRFRWVGSTKEYAPEITTTNGTVYAEDLTAHNERMKKQQEQRIQQENERLAKQPKGTCPLKGSNITKCSENCVLYDGKDCMIVGVVPEIDTTDRLCPFLNLKCNDQCMIYKNGCTIVARLRKGTEEV